MKNLICTMIFLTSISSFGATPRMIRDCEGDQFSSVSLNQVQNASEALLASAQSVTDRQQAILRLGLISGKSNAGEMTNEQYYALVALSGRNASIHDLIDGSCRKEYSLILNIFNDSTQLVESIKKQLSPK